MNCLAAAAVDQGHHQELAVLAAAEELERRMGHRDRVKVTQGHQTVVVAVVAVEQIHKVILNTADLVVLASSLCVGGIKQHEISNC